MHARLVRLFFLVFLATLVWQDSSAQPCTRIGQTPSTAFPICGTSVFFQSTVPLCDGKDLPGPCPYPDVNPYWYKFTCFSSGTLAFNITPNDLSEDYDWQIFDITGHNPNEVYSDASLFLTCGWSGESGITGASAAGTRVAVCGGYGQPLFSKMSNLIEGHIYLLMISHFTPTQSGYGLSFGGGTASITDTTPPRLRALQASCDGKTMGIKLNKKMKCSSLAANGSDFVLSPAAAIITGATATSCSSGFDMDSIVLTLNGPLPAGTYEVMTKNGTDNNTILDYCDNPIPVGDKQSTSFQPAQPTPMDSIVPVLCSPDVLQLVFRNPMQCSSIAPDGSDFTITGPAAVSITAATGDCNGGHTSVINIQLAAPVLKGGIYTLRLQKGTDGNTLLNECTKETPAGSTIAFTCYDTVSAKIDYIIKSSCKADTVHFSNAGGHGINSWNWMFEDGTAATGQNALRIYTDEQDKSATLIVSNGVCKDTSAISVSLTPKLHAVFNSPAYVCPLDSAHFTDASKGPVTGWKWDFGNGQSSTLKDPPDQHYPNQITLQEYTVMLVVNSANNCTDTTTRIIQVPGNCYIAVPNAFTPNGDGLNDYLYPLNAYKATHLEFKVYNRYGQLVWQTTDWTHKWDGTFEGKAQGSGVYIWHLTYTDDEGKPINLKGTSVLIR